MNERKTLSEKSGERIIIEVEREKRKEQNQKEGKKDDKNETQVMISQKMWEN